MAFTLDSITWGVRLQNYIFIVSANAAVLISRGAQIALNSMYFFGSANGIMESSILHNNM